MNNSGSVTIIGAGPVGSLMSVFLARRGFEVTIFEGRPDMRSVVLVRLVECEVAELATGSDLYRIVSKSGGRLCVICTITQPDVIRKILDHVNQQQSPPTFADIHSGTGDR